jgi:hypothetical protein
MHSWSKSKSQKEDAPLADDSGTELHGIIFCIIIVWLPTFNQPTIQSINAHFNEQFPDVGSIDGSICGT